MSYFTLHRTLAVINLFILLVLAVDTFVLPASYVREIYDRRYSNDTRSGKLGTRHFTTDYIVTATGEEFPVPDNYRNSNIGLNGGDTFYVAKGLLLRQPVTLIFRWGGGYAGIPMNFLNDGFWGPLMVILIAIVSLLQLFPRQLIRNDGLNERLIFFGTAAMAICLFFFFYH